MNRLVTLLFVIAAFVVTPLAASAEVITLPSDLDPGETYRLAFVTSTVRDALSSDIADYNSFVAAVAAGVPELAALETTWTAIGSTATVDARDNTGTNPSSAGVPIYRLDDTRIANDNADLWDGGLAAPIYFAEDGGPPPEYNVILSGTTYAGVADAIRPLGALGNVNMADPRSALGGWIHDAAAAGSTPRPMYGMSGILKVVPEPSTLFLVCSGAIAVVGCLFGRRRRCRRQ